MVSLPISKLIPMLHLLQVLLKCPHPMNHGFSSPTVNCVRDHISSASTTSHLSHYLDIGKEMQNLAKDPTESVTTLQNDQSMQWFQMFLLLQFPATLLISFFHFHLLFALDFQSTLHFLSSTPCLCSRLISFLIIKDFYLDTHDWWNIASII